MEFLTYDENMCLETKLVSLHI